MYRRPHFSEYVMARLITLAVLILICFSLIMVLFIPQKDVLLLSISLLSIALTVFLFAISRGAKRMQKELRTINLYLKDLEKIEKIDYKTHFFTQEFDEINQHLMKVLKNAKKREDIKQRYNAKLKLKNRQRADMLSAIAHEFRNPIASIMGYSQTLVDDPDIPPLLREKFLGKIYNNGNKIESLLARLLMWNKFESKETTLHKTKFDILKLSEEIKVSLIEKYPQREIEIIGQEFIVFADRTLMEVVLKNLIENALKYSKEKVVVLIEKQRIAIVDNGAGIAKKEIEKVTKKFYRSGTHSWDNSMGLGLSIVKTILTLHGSKLEIESQIGVGSTFSFKL